MRTYKFCLLEKGGRLTAIKAAHLLVCLSRYMTDQGRALKERYQWEARAQYRDKPVKGMRGKPKLELLAQLKDRKRLTANGL